MSSSTAVVCSAYRSPRSARQSLRLQVARPEESKRDAGQRDAGADVVPRVGAVAVDGPAPEVGQDDEEAAVDGVQAAKVGRRLQRRYEAVPTVGIFKD